MTQPLKARLPGLQKLNAFWLWQKGANTCPLLGAMEHSMRYSPENMENHELFMSRALELSLRGGRAVAPNPMVGAVVVHDGKIIGEGYHQNFGGPHAEVHAIRSVADRELLSGATLYVTLEPCSHFGKTPPCADLVLSSGIRHVVVACRDPFPAVSGRGIEKLREAGVTVTEGILEPQCTFANRRFITAHSEHRPYTILKWAQTRDGFIAPEDRSRRWISSESSRALVHRWRAQEMAVLVGRVTASVDNPQLTVREVAGVNPTRVVLDPSLSLAPSLAVFDNSARTLVFNSVRSGQNNAVTLCLVDREQWSLGEVCRRLVEEGITSLIVEGGQKTLEHFIDQGLWDEFRVFTSPDTFASGVAAPQLPTKPLEELSIDRDSLSVGFNPSCAARLKASNDYLLKAVASLQDA